MDSAVARPAPAMLVPAENGLPGRLAALPVRTRVMLAIGVLALVGVLAALAFSARQGEYRLLFANLGAKDGGQIIDKLQQMQVPYRFAEGTGSILVPADKVYELRMQLTAAGLPQGSNAGYETLDQAPVFGMTQRRESMSLQRAREGELVRTIETLDSVAAARVHLAIPQTNGFFREQEKPSASVVLTLHPGRTLDRAQIAGIAHLVSRSVPDLKPADVSIIDHTGALLNPAEGSAALGLNAMQLEYRRQIEAANVTRVRELLEPVVGRENLRVTVTADVDFAQVESTAEEYKPNGDPQAAAVRAVRTEAASRPGANVPSGVPGAQSNQPATPATAPIDGPAQPMQAAPLGGAAGAGRSESETRYELDRTVRVTRGATGNVRRLSTAVVVDDLVSTDAKGRSSSTPRTPEAIAKLTALVKEAIGFDAGRGDTVQVINAPFRIEPTAETIALPLWRQPWLQDLLRSAAAPAALTLVALLALFGFVRPALKQILARPAAPVGGRLDAVVDDEQALPEPAPSAVQALEAPNQIKLDGIRTLARDNPAAVATIMRQWVSDGAAG